jgi:hypothetical protein
MATLAELWDSDESGLKSDLSDRLEQAKDAYKKQYGKELPVTSGFRTYEQQAALASKPNKYPVARPGTSAHETGDAVDIDSSVPNDFLKQFGLHRPYANDAVHVQVMPSAKGTQSLASLWDKVDVDENEPPKAEKSVLQQALNERQKAHDVLTGLGEAGLATISGAVMPLVAGVKGIAQSIPQAIQTGQAPAPIAEKIASQFLAQHPGYQPTTPQGREYIESLQKAFESSKLPPVMPEIIGQGTTKPAATEINEAFNAAKQLKKEASTLPVAKEMAGVGAAQVDAARMRQQRGNELLIPMGDDLTKSQITRNPSDVTFEREIAKSPEFGGPLQEKYALQNKKLQQNLQAEVDQTGAEMVGMDAPQFGKNISDSIQKYRDARYKEVSDAYKLAQDAGETAQPVSYKSILDLISKETEGRPTKKAQNPLYSIVEEELKANDPNETGMIPINSMEDIRKLINEEADPSKKGTIRLAKQLKSEIDKSTENAGGDLYKEARSKNRAFEAEFEDQGIIKDINRLKKGTSDRVVPLESLADKLVFQGTGADVQAVFKTLENMGEEGQQIAKELRGYAAEKIRQEATKGVGRDIEGKPYVSTAALDKIIKALDKSGKLDFLFGPKQAERFRTLNEFTKDLQTVPQGTVNTSGTTATLLSALAEMGASTALTGIPAPIATIATYGYKHHKTSQKLKKVQEYANPTTKLSDIGKQ